MAAKRKRKEEMSKAKRRKPYYKKDGIIIYKGDCLVVMQDIEENSIDTIITDPPYALEFMGKGWDKVLPPVDVWKECLRVAKPGAMLMAFGGTRTYHRLTCAIEDAGWEIRDCVMWVYGSGFPKSHDISKGIDKDVGVTRDAVTRTEILPADLFNEKSERDVAEQYAGATNIGKKSEGKLGYRPGTKYMQVNTSVSVTAPATEAAKKWNGYGTALKPAWEPIVLAMKPLDGTFAQNALKWGVAGLWIDGGRIGTDGESLDGGRISTKTEGWDRSWKHDEQVIKDCKERGKKAVAKAESLGRWLANLIHDGSEEVLGEFAKAGESMSKAGCPRSSIVPGNGWGMTKTGAEYDDSGTAARFFYCAKASKAERNKGCEDMEEKHYAPGNQAKAELKRGNTDYNAWRGKDHSERNNFNHIGSSKNNHSTVKPISLMRYLCRLTRMPEGGTVLDPFMGSGSTGIACKLEGRDFIGIEKEKDYCEIAKSGLHTPKKN